MRQLAIFDLDDTLLAGDSDYLWGEYLCENNIAEPGHQAKHAAFHQDYQQGKLDMVLYLKFQLATLTTLPPAQLDTIRNRWLHHKILPLVLPDAIRLVNSHRAQGHTLMIITSTNSFLTEPIASYFDIGHLIATEPEQVKGLYTGAVKGEPSFAKGKVTRLKAWLQQRQLRFPEQSWFYSDSHNDLPLLQAVTNPVAVDPDPMLRQQAQQHGWPVISLRNTTPHQPSPHQPSKPQAS
ncbi:MAG: HAD family hydrolase [Candidatus Porifericomitaceae bacterium WSBS_2022_MAG_OTU9]